MKLTNRQLAYALLRAAIGFTFFFYGFGKVHGGVGQFVQGLEKDFSATFLPGFSIRLFGYALPFLELTVGALLLLGLFTKYAAALGGLLIIVLTAGLAITSQAGTVAHNLIYAIVLFLLIYHVDENGLCLDRAGR